jgi:hypothetical protein
MQRHLLVTAGLALAASLATAPSWAAVSSSAQMGPLRLQLFDLDPSDGITPSLQFTNMGSNTSLYTLATTPTPYAYDMQIEIGTTPWQPGSIAALAGVAQASAAIEGSGSAADTRLWAAGGAGNFDSPYSFESARYSGSADAPLMGGVFTLSANTFAVLSGVAAVAASGTATTVLEEYAAATVHIELAGLGGGGSGAQSAQDTLATGGYGSAQPFSFSSSRLLSVSFLNLTTDDLSGTLSLTANVSGYVYATPVPEPRSWALLLVGLTAVGWRARRR